MREFPQILRSVYWLPSAVGLTLYTAMDCNLQWGLHFTQQWTGVWIRAYTLHNNGLSSAAGLTLYTTIYCRLQWGLHFTPQWTVACSGAYTLHNNYALSSAAGLILYTTMKLYTRLPDEHMEW